MSLGGIPALRGSSTVAGTAGTTGRAINMISLGGRNYRAIKKSTIISRDTRPQELQQISRVEPEGEATYLEEDVTCVRNIDWMIFLLSLSLPIVPLLEEAQDAIKNKRCVESDAADQIRALMAELLPASERIMPQMEAEFDGLSAYLGQPTAENIQSKLSRKLIFRVGRNDFDLDLERWHLLLACWATCLTLFWVPCQRTPFLGIGERGRQEYAACVHARILARSMNTPNLVHWIIHQPDQDCLDLRHIHTTTSMPAQSSSFTTDPTAIKAIDIEAEIKQLWHERMRERRESCCQPHHDLEKIILDHLWRSLSAQVVLSEAQAYKMAMDKQLSPSDSVSAHADDVHDDEIGALEPRSDGEDATVLRTNGSLPPSPLQQHPTRNFQDSGGIIATTSGESSPGVSITQHLFTAKKNDSFLYPEREAYFDRPTVQHALLNMPPEESLKDFCFRHLNSPVPPAREIHWKKSYIVVGWFPGTLVEPIEACMWYFDDNEFLPSLKRQISQLRGWRQFLSLKTVQAFGLYKCDLEHRCHTNYQCTPSEKTILSQFYNACYRKKWRKRPGESVEWADWVQLNLNNNGDTPEGRLLPLPFQCHRSLKLIIKWSRFRLILAASVPLFLSMAVGFWFHIKKGDVQTAYTIASYIVTAGAFALALLAILTSLQDGGADLGWAFTARARQTEGIDEATQTV